jgi:signal transduction histidine kinase
MQPQPKISILLVDDQPENLLALEAILADLDQNLVQARSGREALKRLLEEDFAVILLDVQMPEMDGFETARLIRERERSQFTPIIFVTAIHRAEEHVLQAYSVGAVDYVFKPLVPKVLRAKVATFVELARKTEELEAEIVQRKDAEEEVRRLNAGLERRVAERTQELEAANEDLDQLYRQLQERNRRKDQFLTMLAHELRNPLGAVANAFHILRTSQPDQAAWQRAMGVIQRQLKHHSRLLDDLLDVSRITRGRMELHTQPVDLARVILDAAEDCKPALEEAELALSLELPPAPLWVIGDPTRLNQVLMNLLSNAIKFTPPGGEVRVTVEVEGSWLRVEGQQGSEPSTLNPQPSTAVVRIQDTGIGISPEVLPLIFETFTQADESLDRSPGGLGLGLALVKGLVEMHGGEIHAASEGLGRGATFSVRLPLLQASLPKETGVPAAAGTVPLRVLVVEDNFDAADTLRDLLEMAGHEVEVAYSGPGGIEAAQKFRPDVVLCDIGLPGMDGYEVAAALRQDPTTAAARLIAVTGYGEEEAQRRSREAGFEHHLVKPVDPEALQRLLATSSKPA